jgi:DNA-binding beta-propeller fold protein YncE
MTTMTDGQVPTVTEPQAPLGDVENPGRTRRKIVLLLLLLMLLALLTVLSVWYLVFRNPLSELPLPGVNSQTNVPSYSFAFYGPQGPAGLAVSPDGSRVYVAQTQGTRTLMIFDPKGNLIKETAPTNSQGGARTPTYVAVNPTNGDVYVADRFWGAVGIFDKDGTFKQWFKPDPSVTKWIPLGVAFDSKGNLYISNVSQDPSLSPNTVFEFDAASGKLLQTFGIGAGMAYPNGIAVDAGGHVAVADGSNGRLVLFDASGKVLSTVSRGVADGQLGMPRGVAFDDHGLLAVVDTSAQQVDFYSVDANTGAMGFAGAIGSGGRGDGNLAFPTGVGADRHGRLYVADTQNNRIQVWSY